MGEMTGKADKKMHMRVKVSETDKHISNVSEKHLPQVELWRWTSSHDISFGTKAVDHFK